MYETPPSPSSTTTTHEHPEPAPSASATAAVTGHLVAIARCESGGDPAAVSPSGKYRGLLQWDAQTWRSVGGTGDPAKASAAEQLERGAILYAERGSSPWPVCG